MTIVTLGGREFKLARPRGRAGRQLVLKVQGAIALVTDALQILDTANPESLQVEELRSIIAACDKLYNDPTVSFEDVILPAMVVHVEEDGLKDHDAAIAYLDTIEDTPMDLFIQFARAATFWMALSQEEKAQLDEAQKKSPPARKKAEAETK